MAQFEIPEGWTVQAFCFTLDPTVEQASSLARHFGARRKAFNSHCLSWISLCWLNYRVRSADRLIGLVRAFSGPVRAPMDKPVDQSGEFIGGFTGTIATTNKRSPCCTSASTSSTDFPAAERTVPSIGC